MKKNIDILLLIKEKKFFDEKKNYLNILPKNPLIRYPENFSFVNFKTFSRKELIEAYNFCNSLYDSLIIDLAKKLNSFHKLNYSIRSWNIIVGTWLFDYIHTSYKNFLDLNYIKKNYNIKYTELANYKEYNFFTNNSEEFQFRTADTDWSLNFCSLLYEYFNEQEVEIKKINNYRADKFMDPLKTSNKTFSIFNLFNYFNSFFQSKNKYFISNTKLPFFLEKKLEVILKQIPSNYNQPKINYKEIDIKKREFFSFTDNKKKFSFDNFLTQNIKYFIPSSFVENFVEIKKISESKIYPQNVNVIFTSYLYAYDEFFKVYAASQTQKKAKYYIGQHGNNYFTQIHTNNLPEIKNCDKFFSWGHAKKPKVIGLFNFSTLKKKNSNNKKNKLTIILNHLYSHGNNLSFNKQNHIENILSIISIIKKLDKDIKKNTILRLSNSFYREFYGIRCIDFFKNIGVDIDPGSGNLKKVLSKTKLCLFNYDSTGFLENTLQNIPTIVMCDKGFLNSINDEFVSKYQNLISNKIIFEKKEDVINHINKNWHTVDTWWNNEKTKKAINSFNNNLNLNTHKESILDLKNNLLMKTND